MLLTSRDSLCHPHHTDSCWGLSCHSAASSTSGLPGEEDWRIPEGRAEGLAEFSVLPDVAAEVKARGWRRKSGGPK